MLELLDDFMILEDRFMNTNDFTSIIKMLRPKQWLKNFFVFAAVIFSGKFFNLSYLNLNIQVFIAFSLASSFIYIINDIVDRDKDRNHPEKKNRPIASGRVSIKVAILVAILISLISLFISFNINLGVFLIILAYILINIGYCFYLKNLVIIDVMVITLGFVLRVESGSVATKVSLSPWLILSTILLSLFLAINKRKSELLTLKGDSETHRKILGEYSIEFTNSMLSIVTPSILISYCLYSFQSVQGNKMMLTIPFVLYGIFRYQYLTVKKNLGGKPEDVFFKDKPFLIDILLWVFSVMIILYII